MDVDSVVDWASNQPDWQQDALRRIASSMNYSDTDISAILVNLKKAKGIESKESVSLTPLKRKHLQLIGRDAPLAYLCSIDNVKNANQLASNQTLSFAIDGITLFYGHNGSGKSGYCRILKKFCRAVVRDTIHTKCVFQ